MNEVKPQQRHKHDLILKSRKDMSIDGVENVISFDESQVVLVTSLGELTVEGNGLHISVLDLESGTVALSGEVDGLYYSNNNRETDKGRGFWARLFR